MKIITTISYWTFVAAIALIAVLVVLSATALPWAPKVKVVKSGSMEPAIHVGSIVIIEPTKNFAVGDVITFGKDTKTQIPTTHRIVGIEGEGDSRVFTTKGDANETEDPATTPIESVQGKVLFSVPYVGFLLAFARTKLGFFLLIGVPAIAVFVEEARAIWLEMAKIRRRKKGPTGGIPKDSEPEEPLLRTHTVHVPQKPIDGIRQRTLQVRRVAGASVAALLLVGLFSSGSMMGDTVAYSSTEISGGSTFAAGIFPVQEAKVAPLAASASLSEEVPPETQTADAPAPESTSTTTIEEPKVIISDEPVVVQDDAPPPVEMSEPTPPILEGSDAPPQETVVETPPPADVPAEIPAPVAE